MEVEPFFFSPSLVLSRRNSLDMKRLSGTLLSSSLMFFGLSLSSACLVCGAAATTSKNYLNSVLLPHDGEPAKTVQTELERVVSKHNQGLTENPALKNRNRIVFLDGPERYQPVPFPIAPDTEVVDGNGRLIGHSASDTQTTEINFGQHKQIGGKDYVMAFSLETTEAGTVTGWIKATALLPSPLRSQFATVLAMDVRNTSEAGDAPVSYRIKCASPDQWGDGRIKVRANVDDRHEKHMAATDYVERPGRVCYLLTCLPGHGGVATDILSDGETFVPDAGVPRAGIPLYLPVDSTNGEREAWNEDKLPHEMEFRYGRVGQRYGWIPSADLDIR